jgi:hypothetical protein
MRGPHVLDVRCRPRENGAPSRQVGSHLKVRVPDSGCCRPVHQEAMRMVGLSTAMEAAALGTVPEPRRR